MNANMDEQIPYGHAAKQRVTAAEFAAKYKSKREIYNFLAVDCMAYLQPYHTLTIYFIKDLMSGQKKSKSTLLLSLMHLPVKSSSPTSCSICKCHSTRACLQRPFSSSSKTILPPLSSCPTIRISQRSQSSGS